MSLSYLYRRCLSGIWGSVFMQTPKKKTAAFENAVQHKASLCLHFGAVQLISLNTQQHTMNIYKYKL